MEVLTSKQQFPTDWRLEYPLPTRSSSSQLSSPNKVFSTQHETTAQDDGIRREEEKRENPLKNSNPFKIESFFNNRNSLFSDSRDFSNQTLEYFSRFYSKDKINFVKNLNDNYWD